MYRAGALFLIAAFVLGCFYETSAVGFVIALSSSLAVIGCTFLVLPPFVGWWRAGRPAAVSSAFSTAQLGVSALLAFIFLYYMFLSVFWSSVPYYSLKSFPVLAVMPFIVMAMAFAREAVRDGLDFLVRGLLIAFVPFAVWALVQFFFYPDIFVFHAAHPLTNSNTLAGLFNVVGVLAFGWFFREYYNDREGKGLGWWQLFYGFCVMLMAAGVLATGSRGALLALCAGFPVFFLLSYRQKIVRLLPCLLFGGVGYVLFLVMDAVSKGQVSSLYHSALHGRSYNERWDIWAGVLRLMQDNLWLGNGLGSFSSVFPRFRLEGDQSAGLNAHNDYLHMASELGIIGLGLFLIVLIYGWVRILSFVFWSQKSEEKEGAASVQRGRDVLAVASFASALLVFLLQGLVSTHLLVVASCVIVGVLGGVCFAYVDLSFADLGRVLRSSVLKLPDLWRLPFLPQRLRVPVHVFLIGCFVLVNGAFVFAALWSAPVEKHLLRAQSAMISEDLGKFDGLVQKADQHSFGMNAGVYFLSAQLPYNVLLSGGYGLSEAQVSDMRNRLDKLYDKALSLNPYMAVIWHQRAMLAYVAQDNPRADLLWREALEIDPGLLSARRAYADMYLRAGDVRRHDEILLGGLRWRYMRFDPVGYYASLRDVFERLGLDGAVLDRLEADAEGAQKAGMRSAGARSFLLSLP